METSLLPLFPLPNVVHFPHTFLRLHVFEPRYRTLVLDLLARPAEDRLIGIALVAPQDDADAAGGLLSPGTAGRLVAVEALPDGRYNIALRGAFRFAIEREIGGKPYRQALVRPLFDGRLPSASEIDRLQSDLLADCGALAMEAEEAFPVSADELMGLARRDQVEELVNRLADELDLPLLRKQHLLGEDLVERAASLRAILRGRRQVLDTLRPFRRPDPRPELN